MVLQLTFNDFLRMRDARGAAIEVLDGRVWITEDGRMGDLFLEPGRSYRVSGRGLVVVGAEGSLHYAKVIVKKAAGAGLWSWIRTKIQEHETRKELNALSDRMLKDIGLRRDQL